MKKHILINICVFLKAATLMTSFIVISQYLGHIVPHLWCSRYSDTISHFLKVASDVICCVCIISIFH